MKFEEKSQLLGKVIDGLFSTQRNKHTVANGTCVAYGTFLVAHATHFPWANFFSFDTSNWRDISYNGKKVPW